MRILRVRFKNLNSLVGEWEIDLTHPAFASEGIFAITGPTGAGKTTILDAICLALYGRTPRLNRLSKQDNELMSRQTGECLAEVTFETQAGRYRCHWSQHRARKKPGGELQPPRHEIADAASGQILESRLRDVARRIQAVTGMDFEQFTRSMLLAQGGFAAFLQAAANERAPILEQITGTEIYSEISVRVHERRADERKRLDQLEAELAGMPLLSEEEERQLNDSLAQKGQHATTLDQQITQNTQAIAWLDGITQLEEGLRQVTQQQQALQVEQAAFAPDRERLRQATQALELAGEYAGLESIRGEQEGERKNHGECQALLPAHEAAVKQAEEAMQAARGQLEARKAEQQQAAPRIRRARELDLKIQEKDDAIKAASEEQSSREHALATHRAKQEKDGAALAEKRKALEGLQRELDKTEADAALVEQLAGIRERCDTLTGLHAEHQAKLEALGEAERQVSSATRTWQERKQALESQRGALKEREAGLAQKQQALKDLLETHTLADWRKQAATLKDQALLLDRVGEAADALAQSRQTLDGLTERHKGLMTEASTLAEMHRSQVERRAALEREIGLLETQLTLLQKIQDLDEARHQLQDGEPCPLCGAREHPFAAGNVPQPDETRQRLSATKGDLRTTSDTITQLQVQQAKVNKDLEQIASNQREQSERAAAAEARIREACELLPLAPDDPALDEQLAQLRDRNRTDLDRATAIVQAAEEMETEVAKLREALERARAGVVDAEREAQHAAHQKESAGQQLERLKQEAGVLQARRDSCRDLLQQDVAAYGVTRLSLDHLDQVQAQLTARRDQWLSRQEAKSALEQQIAALVIQTGHHAEQRQQLEDQLGRQRERLAALGRERAALGDERVDLFGDKNPDHEERRLLTAIEAAEQGLETARRQLNAASQEQAKLNSRIEELAQSIAARDARLQSAEEAFVSRLNDLGFANEERFKAACLPGEERKALARREQALAEKQTALTTKEQELTRQLESERRKGLTEQPREQLDQALKSQVADQKALQEEIGGIRQRLEENQRLKQQQQERLRAIEAQQRECARWDRLHELIGSADGKKYRNFAQGLTFEMMIGHANRQLQKMTDRYLLIRDKAQPLELNVIDNYQAGEIRSTKNLSGGESFIVSLSLALGLSHMASKNVRVDSLFLDEGFGTLDEEALETALETLAGLRQDGKLIGVISHVPALKERISAQIQVIPQNGGRSEITGPGCQRVTGK